MPNILSILALLAIVLSIVNAFSVTTVYSSSDCALGSTVSRAIYTDDCATGDVVYDTCTKGAIDGAYYIYNSSYCNSTTAPEPLDGFYSVSSWYSDTNCTGDYSLRIEVVTLGEAVPVIGMSSSLFEGTIQFQCDATDSLYFSQCVPDSACFNGTVPHATCTHVGSALYQTSCYEHRTAPVPTPSTPQSMMPSAAGPSSASQPMSAPQTKTPSANTSGSSTTVMATAMIDIILLSSYVMLF